jgi:hypothetical protein
MDFDTTCPGCGARLRRKGLSGHRKTFGCQAESARRSFAARGWVTVGWYSGTLEGLKLLGAPLERARTGRKSGGRQVLETWTPRWALHLADILRSPGHAEHHALMKRLVARCEEDETTERALRALVESAGINHLTVPMVVAFAEAALPDVVSHDVEVKQAVEQLRDVLRRTSG